MIQGLPIDRRVALYIKLKQNNGTISGDDLKALGIAQEQSWFDRKFGGMAGPEDMADLVMAAYRAAGVDYTLDRIESEERQRKFEEAMGAILLMSATGQGGGQPVKGKAPAEKTSNGKTGKSVKQLASGNKSATTQATAKSRFSGRLLKVNNPDPAADALAKRIRGESRVKFESDPAAKEFDAISNNYIAETKPALRVLNERIRKQMKTAFEAAKATGRKVYYHFEGAPGQEIINKLYEYSERYNVEVIIDVEPLFK